jgi:hypothetical protein
LILGSHISGQGLCECRTGTVWLGSSVLPAVHELVVNVVSEGNIIHYYSYGYHDYVELLKEDFCEEICYCPKIMQACLEHLPVPHLNGQEDHHQS